MAISSSFAAMSPAWLALRSASSFWEATTASERQRSRRSVVRTPDWHRAPRKKTAWKNHHRKPCSSSIRANGYVNRKQHIWLPYKGIMVTPAVYPRLFSHHFDIQSTTRKSHCHGYSRRLPALVVNHFDNQCSVCLSPPKPKFNERFARPSTMVSLKCIYVIINRQGSHNIRNGIAWAQTGHGTFT